MYDGKTQLLIKNPINRYLINSPMLPNMKKNADGSLTLHSERFAWCGQGEQLVDSGISIQAYARENLLCEGAMRSSDRLVGSPSRQRIEQFHEALDRGQPCLIYGRASK
jgi:hypothetical protein